jgi:TolA-binding protein
LLAGALLCSACTVSAAKKHYVLAESLWNEGKYAPAVAEFEKVSAKDPQGKLGLQALYRAATTQMLFLAQYGDAMRKFASYADSSADEKAAWEAERAIGEILFTKTEQYDRAISHYNRLLRRRPDALEAPEFLFRVGKSQFFLWQFDESIATYRDLIQRFPQSTWAERAAFEIGVNDYTRGEQHPGGRGPGMESYERAMEAYRGFLKSYPRSELAPQARFGIASCLEELDKLDDAFEAYEQLRATYPSPKVVEIKLARIRERMAQRSR